MCVYARVGRKGIEIDIEIEKEDVTQTLYANIYQLESIGCTDRSEVGEKAVLRVGCVVWCGMVWYGMVYACLLACLLAAGVSIFVTDELCGLYRSQCSGVVSKNAKDLRRSND